MRLNYLPVPYLAGLVLTIILFNYHFLHARENIITIDEAVNEALQNNPDLQKQKFELLKAEGLLTRASVLPNPVLSYYKEDLSINPVEYGEWNVTGSIPINFLWNRWSAINSASSFYDAQLRYYEFAKIRLIARVKSAYFRQHYLNEIFISLQDALEIIEEAKQIASARENEGDISGYDKQRIELEYIRYRKNNSDAKTELQSLQRELSFLINPASGIDVFQTKIDFYEYKELPEIDSLIASSKETRADYLAEQHFLESKKSRLSYERINFIPEVSLSLGYKKQTDDLKGMIYQVTLGIPIFNRNQSEVEIAEAELNQQAISLNSLSRRIELEIMNAYQKLKEYESQLKEFDAYSFVKTDEIIETAKFSYEEGEMSLFELLDALRAYTDAFQIRNELLMNYYLSLFELQKSVGKEF